MARSSRWKSVQERIERRRKPTAVKPKNRDPSRPRPIGVNTCLVRRQFREASWLRRLEAAVAHYLVAAASLGVVEALTGQTEPPPWTVATLSTWCSMKFTSAPSQIRPSHALATIRDFRAQIGVLDRRGRLAKS